MKLFLAFHSKMPKIGQALVLTALLEAWHKAQCAHRLLIRNRNR